MSVAGDKIQVFQTLNKIPPALGKLNLHLCTKYHDYNFFFSEATDADANFLHFESFRVTFLPFNPYSRRKNNHFQKRKKHLERYLYTKFMIIEYFVT